MFPLTSPHLFSFICAAPMPASSPQPMAPQMSLDEPEEGCADSGRHHIQVECAYPPGRDRALSVLASLSDNFQAISRRCWCAHDTDLSQAIVCKNNFPRGQKISVLAPTRCFVETRLSCWPVMSGSRFLLCRKGAQRSRGPEASSDCYFYYTSNDTFSGIKTYLRPQHGCIHRAAAKMMDLF